MGRNPSSMTRRQMFVDVIVAKYDSLANQNIQLTQQNKDLKKKLHDYSKQQDYKNS